jgi:hypothetical protein
MTTECQRAPFNLGMEVTKQKQSKGKESKGPGEDMTLDTIELYTREEMRDGWMGHPIHGCRKA